MDEQVVPTLSNCTPDTLSFPLTTYVASGGGTLQEITGKGDSQQNAGTKQKFNLVG